LDIVGAITEGDADPQITFAAVGRVLTEWEQAEAALSSLYTLLDHNPGDFEVYRKYGAEGRIFRSRVVLLERAGKAYFSAHPNQDDEGELREILALATTLSEARNRVAHGYVEPIIHLNYDNVVEDDDKEYEDDDETNLPERTTLYHLNAPWFSEERLKAKWPGLGSSEMATFSKNFEALTKRIEAFVFLLLERDA
jgi:hypothetical protein